MFGSINGESFSGEVTCGYVTGQKLYTSDTMQYSNSSVTLSFALTLNKLTVTATGQIWGRVTIISHDNFTVKAIL